MAQRDTGARLGGKCPSGFASMGQCRRGTFCAPEWERLIQRKLASGAKVCFTSEPFSNQHHSVVLA